MKSGHYIWLKIILLFETVKINIKNTEYFNGTHFYLVGQDVKLCVT